METLSSERIAPRRPGVAMLLTFFFPGLGHIYCGRFGKGLALLVIDLLLATPLPWALVCESTAFRAFVLGSLGLATTVWVYALIDIKRIARRLPADYRLKDYNRWYVYALMLVMQLPLPVSIAFVVRETAFQAFYVPSESMVPTISPGERLLVTKVAYQHASVRRGDVVVFIAPNERHISYIKRVVALPGDTFEMRGGEVYVNGAKLERSGVTSAAGPSAADPAGPEVFEEVNGSARYRIEFTPVAAGREALPGDVAKIIVPNGTCYVLGDNRNESLDSRKFGPVPLADITGRAEFIYWPRYVSLHPWDGGK
jgi:signal peptidase I